MSRSKRMAALVVALGLAALIAPRTVLAQTAPPPPSSQEPSVEPGDKKTESSSFSAVPLPIPVAETASSARQSPPLAESPPPSKVPAYVMGGLAIGLAGVGTVFGVIALSTKSDFDQSPSASSADSTEKAAIVSDLAFGAAITLGVTALFLLLRGGDAVTADPPQQRASDAKGRMAWPGVFRF